MVRMLFGVVIGASLTLVIVFSYILPSSASGHDTEFSGTGSQDITTQVRNAMLSPLQKSAAESAKTESGKYLNKLIGEYRLDDLPAGKGANGELADMVPDIKAINEKAMALPLFEAGKQIQDREIAAFYYDFLKRSGWTVPQPEGE